MASASSLQSLFDDLAASTATNEIIDIEDAPKKREIWVADAETDPFKKGRVPEPFIWGAYNGENYFEFISTEDFIEFISQQHIICYAHNGGKFDWHFITDYIDNFEPLTCINGRLAKFQIGECEFRDSFNIIPAPLSAYKKDEIDYAIFEREVRHDENNWRLIREYLKADCIYLYEMVTKFIEDYGLNLTQASAAMKTWTKMSKIKKPNSGPHYYASMKQFYYGGRVECFEKGVIEDKFEVADIKSAYPYAMVHNHPWGLTYDTLDHLPDYFSDIDIQHSFLILDTEAMGAFPIRGEEMGLSFPSDLQRRSFSITGWEYLAARDTNTLGNAIVKEVRHYYESINFKDYVEHFFELKRIAEITGDAAGRLFAKLFLNSLYGKFASNPENYEEFMTLPVEYLEGASKDKWAFCKMLNTDTAVVCRPLDEEKRRYYDVAVAASVTGFVRAYLWRNICACDGPIYCDTDSIAARNIDRLNIGNNLGEWEHEKSCIGGAVAGKKLYAFKLRDENGKWNGKYKTASKGVRLSADDIYKVARGEIVTFEPEVPTFSIKKKSFVFTPRAVKMT